MARKRMFDSEIINQDSFFDLSLEAKALYFLLGMGADDEGFIAPKKILKLNNVQEKNLNELISSNFIIQFESGVVVIVDWKRNNYLNQIRVVSTIYQDEKKQLEFDENTLKYTCLTNVKQMLNQNRIEENSTDKNRKEENRIEIVKKNSLNNSKYIEEFERLWNLFPNKRSKNKALNYYITSRSKGTTYEDVENGLYNYLDYITREKIEPKFIKHGSTWFFQECWKDEYLIKPKSLKDISISEINEAVKIEKEKKGEIISNDTIRIFSGMKKLSNYYLKDITNDQITAWYDMFQKVDYDIFEKAIIEISTKNNYMPTAGMLYEKCSLVNKSKLCNLIQYMYEDGYFHNGIERLTDEQASRNLDKTLAWVEKGIVPEFLIKDMELYLRKYNQKELNNEERLQIKG